MIDTKEAQFSIKWDVRTGSPRKLWRALYDFLDRNGFEHEYEELKPEESPIEGTATFRDQLIEQREREKRVRFWFLRILISLLLCPTMILIPLGLRRIRSSLKTIRTMVSIDVEDEVYRSRGANIHTSYAAEVLDAVADVRVTLQAWVGETIREKEGDIRLTKDETKITRLRHEFAELSRRLDELLPKISLCSI